MNLRQGFWLWMVLVFQGLSAQDNPHVAVHRNEIILGTSIGITLVCESEEEGYILLEEAFATFRRIEKLTSVTLETSEISQLNSRAGEPPVEVGDEVYQLLERALHIAQITEGAYDPVAAPNHSFRELIFDPEGRKIGLPEETMQLEITGIARGYGIEQVRNMMRMRQVPGGMINAGGLVGVWGRKASGERWLLGISDPNHVGQILKWIPLIESSVFLWRPGGKVDQVTVFAGSAELAQCLGLALGALGPEKGIPLVEILGDTEVILTDSTGIMYWSRGLDLSLE